jgi:uncharacterized protein (TIGR00299 family) protein
MLELHLDPIGGIAGDMFTAALLDLRPDLETELFGALSRCPLLKGVTIELLHHNDGVLTGRRFLVRRNGQAPEDQPTAGSSHHGHVDWSRIRAALLGSELDSETVKHAIGIFTHLAEAEARVHGTDPEHVQFHEVGAWDSIADIVAAAWLITRIGASRWTVGALPLGSGRVRTAHGLLAVPAPATALLMEGFATIDDGVAGERVTPTGAAILRHLCDPFAISRAPRRLLASGHGFGTKQLPGLSNCLRLLAFETLAVPFQQYQVAILECEIDDQTGEDIAQAIDNLRGHQGVIDVVQIPVFGKKGRLMTHLRVLAEPAVRDDVLAAIFDETTTIGIRHSLTDRAVLPRQAMMLEGDGRPLRLKIVERPSGRTAKLEADDLASVRTNAARTRLRRQAEDGITEDQS